MPTCQNCKEHFPWKTIVDGKEVDLRSRKYCLNCNPVGSRKFWGGKKVERINGKRILQKKEFTCVECKKKYKQKTRNLICSTCRNKKIRHVQKKKAIEYKGGRCIVCGYNKCYNSLDFHHLNGLEKKFSLSTSWQKSWKEIEEEIKKCVLLCRNCHAELHSGMFCILSEKTNAVLSYPNDYSSNLDVDDIIIKKSSNKISCKKCGEVLKKKNKNNLCKKCRIIERNKNKFCCEICGKEIKKRNKNPLCRECFLKQNLHKKVKDRPSKEQLLKEIEETNYCAVGRKYGVSDNCIRKWLK